MNLQKWANDYMNYVKFQIETLPYSYQYGGDKFDARDFPKFQEFQINLGTNRCFIKPTTATDIDFSDNPTFHNVINTSCRWDLFKCRILWKEFKGVRFNFHIFFDANKTESRRRNFAYLALKIRNGFWF
jgi:hypothetical protein